MLQIDQSFSMTYEYPVCFDRDVFAPENMLLEDILSRAGAGPHRILPVTDSKVLEVHSDILDRLEHYANVHGDTMELLGPPMV
ncbi:MAG: hypothetical protein RLN85_19210, partial [Pseudomonadales bacterium]